MEMRKFKVTYEPWHTSSCQSQMEMSGRDEDDVVQQFRKQYPQSNLLSVQQQ